MGVTDNLAKFAMDTNYRDLPPKTVQYAKEMALSTLGSMLWGSSLPAGRIVAKLIRESGGSPEAGVVGSGFRTSVPDAALAGGNFAHAAEWEAVSLPEMTSAMTIFPVVFSLGEKLGSSGKDILEATIVAYEVQSRIGLACLPATERGFFALPVFGNFGAAVASAKLLKLSLEQIIVAMSLAASQAAGTLRQHDTMAHFVETGFACRNGVMAAMLAKAGFTADMNILEDTSRGVGFGTAVAGKEGYRIERITEGLGREFRFELLDSKHFPCHSQQQRALEGVLHLITAHKVTYQNVEGIEIEMKPMIARQLDLPDPPDGEHARTSIQHGIVAAMLEKRIGRATFSDEKAVAYDFKEARKMVKIIVHPEWEREGLKDFEIVTIRLKNGQKHSIKCETWRGHHTSPFTREELIAKYEDAASDILSQRQVERSLELVLDLENQANVVELMRILTFPNKK